MTGTGAGPDDDDGWLVAGSTDSREVAAYYDEWAGRYDRDLNEWSYRAPAVVADLVMEHCSDATSILDAGCGTGLCGGALRAAGYTGDLHGIDVSEESLALARRSGAYTTVSSANLQEPLAYDDGIFDAVTCVGVMTYVPDVDACWRGFCRVVRPGGVIAATQRSDLWEPRDTQGALDRIAADALWTPIWVSDTQLYLPGNDEFADQVGVRYVVARVR